MLAESSSHDDQDLSSNRTTSSLSHKISYRGVCARSWGKYAAEIRDSTRNEAALAYDQAAFSIPQGIKKRKEMRLDDDSKNVVVFEDLGADYLEEILSLSEQE
ncbi:hypothetical protein CTI12_AA415610 [Artemisia annua]|uniref:AP2/ERF domain-containing protein n=1 Tax=Artemisia annua TaxID=35608 RepID=A0A2U1M720_ARTAN|nr:hypothetical protein CTI12_AA415610 [Artemisia annua]